MEFESVIKIHYPHIASVIYEENLSLKDFHPSLRDDISCDHIKHHKSFLINSDTSFRYGTHPSSILKSTSHNHLTSKISITTSDHSIPNLNIVPSHLDMQHRAYEPPSKTTFRGISHYPCTEAFKTYLYGISNKQDLLNMASSSTPPFVEPKGNSYILHAARDMWDDHSHGFTSWSRSTLNLTTVDSNQYDVPKSVSNTNASENYVMTQHQNIDHIKKNKRVQITRGCKPPKQVSVIKGQWTSDEDRLLVQLVEFHGTKKWSQIAKMLQGRVGKQCRERWHNHLRPDIKKDGWSEEEDIILIETHKKIGNKWAEIARRLPGRTENTIKNHWNATKRRQISRRIKGKDEISLALGSNTLQNYIRSVIYKEATTSNANLYPKNMKRKGKNVMLAASKNNNEDKCEYIFDGVMKKPQVPVAYASCASSSCSASGSGSGVITEIDEPATDSWMVMHGCDEVMMNEIALLEMIAHGSL